MPFLAAVQTRLEADPYRSEADFSHWVLEQTRAALAGRDPDEPALVAFPELIGLPLLFFLGSVRAAAPTVREAALELVRDRWREALAEGLPRLNLTPSALVLPLALELYRAYTGAFSRAARRCRAYIAAGSVFLPGIEEEAARGLYLADGRVRNVSYTFSPGGRILTRTPKLNLTGGLESLLGLTRGRPEAFVAARTGLGPLCTLICYDAFFERPLERADALGAGILVQPSANARPWEGPWSADPGLNEGEQWLGRGPAALIQGRANLRYAVNPMLVGRLFDLEFEGRSSIAANLDLEPGATADPGGLVALAPSPTGFAVVSARVPAFS